MKTVAVKRDKRPAAKSIKSAKAIKSAKPAKAKRAIEKTPSFYLPEKSLPKGSSLPQRILTGTKLPFNLRDETYLETMLEALMKDKFAHVTEAYKADPNFQSDITEEQYRRVERFHDCLVPWVSRAIDLEGKTVVEVGSGTGSSTLAFAPYVKNIHCFEISPPATRIAKTRLAHFGCNNVVFEDDLFNADSRYVKEGGKADIVLLVAVLEHVHFHEFKDILRAAYECLNPGGVILIAETPNRLSFKDYHTSWMLFYQWLPREVAVEYGAYSPRQLFRDSNEEFVKTNGSEITEERVEHLVRWGQGVSYHDFEIALGSDIHNKIVLNGWEEEVRPLAPVFDDDHVLVGIFDHLKIQTNRAFTRSWLYFCIQK